MSAELTIVPDRELWERQSGESAKAFAAFAHYRDSDPTTRSLLNTARHLKETLPTRKGKVESIQTQIGEWSRQWRWVERVEAFEIAEDRRRRLERQAMQRTFEERALAGAQAGMAAVLRRMAGDRQNGVEPLHPNQIADWSEAARILKDVNQVGRLVLGLPTDLLKAMERWNTDEVMKLSRAIIEAALPYIPDERQEEALRVIQDVFLGWGRR